MSVKVPEGYVSLSSLSSHTNREVNLMGVVTDFQTPVRSRGTDWMCNFRLADATVFDDGTKIRFFRPMQLELPKIERNGDVVILERVKITSWSGMLMGISSFNTNWTVVPAVSIPEKVSKGDLNLKCLREKGSSGTTQQQMRYAIELCNSRERSALEDLSAPVSTSTSAQPTQTSTDSSAVAGTPSNYGRRDKFALIKNIEVDKFYDLVGQVVKVYPSNGVVELYLTDYTSNPRLYNYEWGRDDPNAEPDDGNLLYGSAASTSRQWPGPLGKMTITVSLFPPHSYYAQNNVKENQFVFLRNTRIKSGKDVKIEGCLHTDRRNPERVDVTIIKDHGDDERCKDVLRRKLEYTKKFQKQSEAFVEIAQGQKRKQAEPPKLSKGQQRKRRKQQKAQEARKRLNDLGSSDDDCNKENDDPYHIHVIPKSKLKPHNETHSTPPTSPPPARPPKKAALNENIRTSKPDVPPRPLSSIISLTTHALTTPSGKPYTLPFQNINSRAAVRVVDFYPPDIADFAVRKKNETEYDVLSDHSGDSSSCDETSSRLPDDTDDEEDDLRGSQKQSQKEDGIGSPSRWQWRFALVLEDASSSVPHAEKNPRLTAYVTGADAEFLLKLDACNLHRNPQALEALREKLFLLWGDLEELRRKGDGDDGERTRPSNKPFECCIKEYGVRSRESYRLPAIGSDRPSDNEKGEDVDTEEVQDWGWERRFAMFGTTIL